MTRENIEKMNPIMLLSLVNTKLRDEFSSMEDLNKCYNFSPELIEDKLNEVNYFYNKEYNKFI